MTGDECFFWFSGISGSDEMPVTEAPSSGNGNWNGRLKTARQRQPRTLLVSLLEPVFEEDAVAAFPEIPEEPFFVEHRRCADMFRAASTVGHCHSQFIRPIGIDPQHPRAIHGSYLRARPEPRPDNSLGWTAIPTSLALLRAGSFGAARLRMTRHGLRASG